MRYLMLIIVFFMLPAVFFAQQTYVPDDNFEQRLIDLGYDTPPLNDSVPTANIEKLTLLIIVEENISDLTGIEDFTALQYLYCDENDLISLDLSNNYALKILECGANNLTSLDLSNNVALGNLKCGYNNLTSLDVSKNTVLQYLDCYHNELTYLDVHNNTALEILSCSMNNLTRLDLSKNTVLETLSCRDNKLASLDLSNNLDLNYLSCSGNDLTSLNIKNGNNKNMEFDVTGNPNLRCIQVDDSTWSANSEYWKKDSTAHYSEDCGYTGVEEFLTEGTEISIFPNPAGKNFTVSFELETPKTIHLTLTDLSGNELQEFSLEHRQFVNEEIDVSMLSSGIYFLRISFGNESISRKIVVE